AAFLPTGMPGRGYLQVGNEEVELIQVAYTGDEYVDPTHTSAVPVIWPDRSGSYNDAQDQAPPELYKVIISELNKLAKDNQCLKQLAPWPKFLAPQLALSETLVAADPTVRAVTARQYLRGEKRITLGHSPEATLTLNPAMNRWINGHCGWLDRL